MDREDSKFKERAIREMFARIAHGYDRINCLMSWGQDARWRRVAVKLACPASGRVLDVATGTGDIGLELARYTDSVVGLDLCPEMLSRGRVKAKGRKLEGKIDFIIGDALALPFSDNSFECALNGFALRNVANIGLFLTEQRRVVEPGGRVVSLELAKPASSIVGVLYRFYLFGIVPILGRWLSGDDQAYRYLPNSVNRFLHRTEIQRIMEDVGFRRVSHKSLNFGTIAINFGIK